MQELLALPLAVRVGLGLLLVAQLSLQVTALVDIARRGPVPGNKKLVWVLVTVFGNLVGALVYLAIGRKALDDAAAREESLTREGALGDRASDRKRAVDRLYGDRDA